MIIANVALFIASCLFLIFVASLLVKCLTYVAAFLRISDFIIGFIIMAFSTSLPELMVGINAALNNAPSIVLGNVIGANIADLTLVAGTVALLGKGIKGGSKLIKRDAYWMVGIAFLAMMLMYIGRTLSRLDAIILIVAYIIYLYNLIKKRNQYRAKYKQNKLNRWAVLGYFILFLALIPLLFLSSDYVVNYGMTLSLDLALPPIFVGLFFISIGTTLPELAFGTNAVLRKHGGLSLGDLMGSVVVNSTVVLGISALITPITGNIFLFITSGFFMLTICLLFAVFLESGARLTWREGFVLLLFYILFILVEFSLKNYYVLNGPIV